MRRPNTSAKRFSRAQALPTQRGDCDNFSALISGGWEDRCDIGHLREFISEKNRAIPNESADPEQYDRDKRIDLQNVVGQLGRDRTGEVAGRENKAEFHRGWHDKQRRECNFHHTEQSERPTPSFDISSATLGLPVSFSTPKNAIPSAGIQVAIKLIIIGPLVYKVTGVSVLIAPSCAPG